MVPDSPLIICPQLDGLAISKATNGTQVLWQATLVLFERSLTRNVLPLRLLGIGGTRLTRDASRQRGLFEGLMQERQRALDQAIDALVGGVYAGDPHRLSVRHAFPKLGQLEARYGSLIKGQIFGARDRKKSGEVAKDRAVFLKVHGIEPRLVKREELIDLTPPGIEHFITGPKPVMDFEIIVNARPRIVHEEDVTFEQVVELAFPGPHGPTIMFSMTYRHAESKPHAGELGASGVVEVKKKGTIFNVTKTDKS